MSDVCERQKERGGVCVKCPNCGAESRVVGTKNRDNQKLRRRQCTKCKFIFYTVETESANAEFQFRVAVADYRMRWKGKTDGKGKTETET